MRLSIISAAAVVFVMVLAGCGSKAVTTEVKETKTDTAFAEGGQKFQKVLVLVISDKAEGRTRFEEAFAEQFKAHGIDAVTSAGLLPQDEKATRETVQAAIANTDIDAVFGGRLMEVERTEEWTPPEVRHLPVGYNGMMHSWSEEVVMPGYYKEKVTVYVESGLWAVEGAQRVWSASSETYDPRETPSPKDISAFVDSILDRMVKDAGDFFAAATVTE